MKGVNEKWKLAKEKQRALNDYTDAAFKQVSPRQLEQKLSVAIKKVQPVN